MKKEMIRIHNLNVEYSATIKLFHISLCLLEGECVGFLGLVNSGKNMLVDIICGKHEIDRMGFYIDGKRNISSSNLQKLVYKITDSNYLIDTWTVAEYICLVENGFALGVLREKKLEKKAQELLEKLGLDVDVRQRMKDLTELEKRMVDLAKAYSNHIKILVVEDEFEGCSTKDIELFKQRMDLVIKDKMVVIINSHSDNVSFILSDKYVILKKGFIVKKCNKSYIKDSQHLEKYLLEEIPVMGKNRNDNYKNESIQRKEPLYLIENMRWIDKKLMRFAFYKGEVVTILALNVKEKEKIFELLSGRLIDKYMKIVLEKERCNFNDIADFVKNKIVSISDMGGESELLLSMSVGNNLLIPSLDKIPSFEHLFAQNKVVRMLEREIIDENSNGSEMIQYKSVNDHIVILLERWYIYKPKVLVLFEPFVHCDLYGVSLVKSYIKKFIELETTVIIVKSREEYIEDISDRIINMEYEKGSDM
ncbi:MAG: ATP-binding cassette domain-containing protein [Velocimicrobium sp.]